MGWSSYLPEHFGTSDVPTYAAVARRTDLTGFPPTYIAVGDIELFRAEDEGYAHHLERLGVPVEFDLVPGASPGFDNRAWFTQQSSNLMTRARNWLRHGFEPQTAKVNSVMSFPRIVADTIARLVQKAPGASRQSPETAFTEIPATSANITIPHPPRPRAGHALLPFIRWNGEGHLRELPRRRLCHASSRSGRPAVPIPGCQCRCGRAECRLHSRTAVSVSGTCRIGV